MGFPGSRLPILGLRVGMLPGPESPAFKSCLIQLCDLGRSSTSSRSLCFHICKMGMVIPTPFEGCGGHLKYIEYAASARY